MDKAFAAQVRGPEFPHQTQVKLGTVAHIHNQCSYGKMGAQTRNSQMLIGQLAWHTHGHETLSQKRWEVKRTPS